MSRPAFTLPEASTLETVALEMLGRRIGGIPIVDGQGKLSGIITESAFSASHAGVPFSTFRLPQLFGEWLGPEVVESIYARARAMKADAVMERRVISVAEDTPISEVLEKMLEHGIHRIPVVRQGIPVGMIARHDLLKLLAKRL